jgi:hypothetical protein
LGYISIAVIDLKRFLLIYSVKIDYSQICMSP